MRSAARALDRRSWMASLKRAVPEPWFAILLGLLTFLALAICSNVRMPASPPMDATSCTSRRTRGQTVGCQTAQRTLFLV